MKLLLCLLVFAAYASASRVVSFRKFHGNEDNKDIADIADIAGVGDIVGGKFLHENCNCTALQAVSTCKCCTTIDIGKLKFKHDVCFELVMDGETENLQAYVEFDHTRVGYKLDSHNPPPMCIGAKLPRVPFLSVAETCISLKDFDWKDRQVHGCTEWSVKVVKKTVGSSRLGCFHFTAPKV